MSFPLTTLLLALIRQPYLIIKRQIIAFLPYAEDLKKQKYSVTALINYYNQSYGHQIFGPLSLLYAKNNHISFPKKKLKNLIQSQYDLKLQDFCMTYNNLHIRNTSVFSSYLFVTPLNIKKKCFVLKNMLKNYLSLGKERNKYVYLQGSEEETNRNHCTTAILKSKVQNF